MRTSPRGVPALSSAYRLQLRPGFGFAAAARQCGYLRELGVSHVFSSPVLQAAPGSTHGYDVAAPEQISRALGGETAFARWRRERERHTLGFLLDIVPNHMAVATALNRWWWDVLRRGEQSPYARFFDVQYGRPIVLPWLARPLAEELRRGQIALRRRGREWRILYGGGELPVAAGTARSGAEVGTVLARQAYRLAHWRTADRGLTYRRFFDIASLAGVRVEDGEVFAATHARILDWLRDGTLAGVRVDHLDGLREPVRYLQALHAAAPSAWVVAEKILTPSEDLPRRWPVAGTTGYQFLNLVLGLMVHGGGARGMDRAYRAFAGPQPAFREIAERQRARVLRTILGSEVRRLVEALEGLRARHRELATIHRADLESAILHLAVACPVYRTYAGGRGRAGVGDARLIAAMCANATRRQPRLRPLIRFLGRLLKGRFFGAGERDFLLRFQQLTPAVFAKGVEDTAFYRYQRLVALNEVGGDPARFGVSLREFHRDCAAAQRHWPLRLVNTSTHDTKRGEDVRARLALLSEIPAEWQRAALAWARHNQRHKCSAGPDRNLEYLMYQTLVGAWPIAANRLTPYLLKAAREAKQHTSWREPQMDYEAALHHFVHAVLADRKFIAMFQAWLAPLIEAGRMNGLTQTILKLTAPGVPHIYNGSELWDLSLVDPDNRRPVDFALRHKLLAELRRGLTTEAILARQDEGLPKLWLLWRSLRLRRERPHTFGPASTYRALWAHGAKAAHVVAFVRGAGFAAPVATIAQRWPLRRGAWSKTTLRLPSGIWNNVLTGESVRGGVLRLDDLLARFPVALLAGENKA